MPPRPSRTIAPHPYHLISLPNSHLISYLPRSHHSPSTATSFHSVVACCKAGFEATHRTDDMKRSALSSENSPCLKIEDDSPLSQEKKLKLGTETSQSFEIDPIIGYDESYENYNHTLSNPYSDEDEDYDSDTWNKYCDQINKSEGFDVDIEVYPRGCDMAPFQPIPYFKKFPELEKRLEALADLALQFFKTKNSTKFELVEIQKVVRQYWYYYLTFKAKDLEHAAAGAALKTFEAKVYDGFKGPDVELCRIKN